MSAGEGGLDGLGRGIDLTDTFRSAWFVTRMLLSGAKVSVLGSAVMRAHTRISVLRGDPIHEGGQTRRRDVYRENTRAGTVGYHSDVRCEECH